MQHEIGDNALIILMGLEQETLQNFASFHFPKINFIDLGKCEEMLSNPSGEKRLEEPQIFNFLEEWLNQRASLGISSVVGGPWWSIQQRKSFLEIAAKNHIEIVLIAFIDKSYSQKKPGATVHRFYDALKSLKEEGYKKIAVIDDESKLKKTPFKLVPLPVNLQTLTGPFDIIGDVHGCFEELKALLVQLEYTLSYQQGHWMVYHPKNRKLVFVGDLADRGPNSVDTLTLVMDLYESSMALIVKGNHDEKLFRYLKGNKVATAHGLETTISELDTKDNEFIRRLYHFLKDLPSHLVLDHGNLVVTHAAILPKYIGKQDSFIQQYCMYGPTSGQLDENGLPERLRWQEDYQGKAWTIYGHTPVTTTEWYGKTINIDTGAVYGNGLTALRYPELFTVFQPSLAQYAVSKRFDFNSKTTRDNTSPWKSMIFPEKEKEIILDGPALTTLHINVDSLNKAFQHFTNLAQPVQAIPYLPPAIPLAPVSPDRAIGHPIPAIEKYAKTKCKELSAEWQPTGKRCTILVLKDENTGLSKFSLPGFTGSIIDPLGHPVLERLEASEAFLKQVQQALTKAQWWEKWNSQWFVLEATIQYPEFSRIPIEYFQSHFQPWLEETSALNSTLHHALTTGEEGGHFKEDYLQRTAWSKAFTACHEKFNQTASHLHSPKLWPTALIASSTQNFLTQPRNWHFQQLQTLADAALDFIEIPPYTCFPIENLQEWENLERDWLCLDPHHWEGIVIKPQNTTPSPILPGLLCRAQPLHLLYLGPAMLDPSWTGKSTNFRLGTKSRMAEEQQWLAQSLLQHWSSVSSHTFQLLLALLAHKLKWPE